MESQFDQITKVLAQATSRRRALRGLGGGLIGGVLATLGARKAWAQDSVTICHVPPGNPNNVHTITVSSNAIPAHLRHGDAVCAPGNEDCCFNASTSSAVCTNLETDTSNCGVCGNACPNGQSCVAGVCVSVEMCGACFDECGTSADCFCTTSVEGISSCGNNFTCGTTPTCRSSAECIAQGFAYCQGSVCGSCGAGFCVPVCGDSSTAAGLTAGATNRGF